MKRRDLSFSLASVAAGVLLFALVAILVETYVAHRTLGPGHPPWAHSHGALLDLVEGSVGRMGCGE